MPVTVETLSAKYPRLYHMAAPGSWDNIRRHGLLSTSALLDLYGASGGARDRVESAHRSGSVELEHPTHGRAIVRDQRPMDDRGLRRALPAHISPADWYRFLNGRVFFWLCPERLATLMGAAAYRSQRNVVLTVDTRSLLRAHEAQVLLCPINSGATKPMPSPRDYDTFQPLSTYPWEQRIRAGRGKDTVVELTVTGGVPDIVDHVILVEEVDPSGARTPLYTAAG